MKLKSLFKYLPKSVQKLLIRRSINCQMPLPSDTVLKLAETESEFRQAFQLVHDAYVKQGFIANQTNGMNAIPQHLLDSTVVIIAKQDDKVIGTVTLVRDNKLKLPSEKIADLDTIRNSIGRLTEVTCLTVSEEFRRKAGGAIFLHLMKYLKEFCYNYFGADGLISSVYPKDAVFYEALLCFKLLSAKPIDYMGAPAVVVYVSFKSAEPEHKEIFQHKNDERNLYKFFFETNYNNYIFPVRKYCEINYPKLIKGQLLKEFDCQVQAEKSLATLYSRNQYRHDVKCEVNCAGIITEALDVSVTGFKLKINPGGDNNLNVIGQNHFFKFKLNESSYCTVAATLVWLDKNGKAGFSIISYNHDWKKLIEYLDFRTQHFGKVNTTFKKWAA